MSSNPFPKIYEEIQDAKDKVETASALVRTEREKALNREDINMVRVFKEIDLILKSVLEDKDDKKLIYVR